MQIYKSMKNNWAKNKEYLLKTEIFWRPDALLYVSVRQ